MSVPEPTATRHPLHRELQAWIDQGFFLKADPHVDPLAASAHPDDRLLAVRALRNLGADRAGDALCLRGARLWPDHLATQSA